MSDQPENKGEETPPDPPSPPAAPGKNAEPEAKFTQADVDRMVKSAKAKQAKATEKRVRSELESKSKEAEPETPKGGPDTTNRLAAIEAELAKSKADTAFEKALSGLKLTDKQREILRKGFDPENPEDTMALAKDLRAPDEPGEPEEHKPGYQSPGGVSGAPPENWEKDMTKWSKDYVRQLQREGKYFDKLEEYAASLSGGSNGLFRRIKTP